MTLSELTANGSEIIAAKFARWQHLHWGMGRNFMSLDTAY